jgi:CelD/BcsL family acetyltransferase involved in cellulose biosynthesis
MSNDFEVVDKRSRQAGPPPHLYFDILVGEEAFKLITDPKFQLAWECLYNACPWSTVFQSKDFVSTWYQLYYPYYQAVLVKAEQEGELVGLLTLAKQKASKLLIVAGLDSAEYQTWLAKSGCGELFIQEALDRVLTLYPGHDITFHNTPPETPLLWAKTNKKWRERAILKPLQRPLMDLRNPDVTSLFRKKQFREKTNRLKRLGELKFEKVTDPEHFALLLDDLIAQSDFRKGAKYNFFQFEIDPYGKQFLFELFKKGILHTTVLRLDGQVIASIAAPAGNNWVHLAGLNTHSPLYAKHSPGLINFIMLGQLLIEENMDTFDLTPGGDAYKERLATSQDQVHELFISGVLQTKIKKIIIEPALSAIKSILRRKGLTPRLVKNEVLKIKGRLALAIQHGLTKHLSWHYLWKGNSSKTLVCKFKSTKLQTEYPIKVNDVRALLRYKPSQGIYSRWDFLEDAMLRFELGEQVYTLTEKGQLLVCIWHERQHGTEDIAENTLDNAPLVLRGLFIHPRVLDRLQEVLTAVVAAIHQEDTPQQEYYFLVDERNRDAWQSLR